MSPVEAKEYGFVDNINITGKKIAASITISEAKMMNTLLINKLETKMLKIFGKDKKETGVHLLALKGGGNLLCAVKEPCKGSEVAPIGASTLEDGEFELADGRKITVAGGLITEVTDMMASVPEVAAETEAIVAAVAEVVALEVAKVKAEISAEMNAALSKISSSHKPVKGTEPLGGKTPATSVHSKVAAVTAGIRDAIEKSRKA
jgi:hypothetical protein